VVSLRLEQNLVIVIKLESLINWSTFLTTCAYTTWHHKFYNDVFTASPFGCVTLQKHKLSIHNGQTIPATQLCTELTQRMQY